MRTCSPNIFIEKLFSALPVAGGPPKRNFGKSSHKPCSGGDHLTLELSEGHEDVQHHAACGGLRVDLLRDGHEGHVPFLERTAEVGEVAQRTGQAVDLVDYDDVDLSRFAVGQKLLKRGPVQVAA